MGKKYLQGWFSIYQENTGLRNIDMGIPIESDRRHAMVSLVIIFVRFICPWVGPSVLKIRIGFNQQYLSHFSSQNSPKGGK